MEPKIPARLVLRAQLPHRPGETGEPSPDDSGTRHNASMTSVRPRGHPELLIRLAAEASSVPGTRRFVSDGLTDWGREHPVGDAALCVTERATNSARASLGRCR